jgi:hypothetical protein
MNAVWSLWTKPLARARKLSWCSEFHHLLGWVLSVETARKHLPNTRLVTDDAGADLLVEQLGLPFTRVSTALNKLNDCDPDWWVLGKIYAYREQTEPFVHLDTDVFLWKPLPSRMLSADVLAQSSVPIIIGTSYYKPELIEQALGYPNHGWLPDEWIWYKSLPPVRRAEWCGLFGGNRVDFIRSYADQAWRIVTDDRNRAQLELLSGKAAYVGTIEEYFLSACLQYHRERPSSPFVGVQIQYLFNSAGEAFQPSRAREAGFTHLVSEKRNPFFARRIEFRVEREYPELYERCRRVVSNRAKDLGSMKISSGKNK